MNKFFISFIFIFHFSSCANTNYSEDGSHYLFCDMLQIKISNGVKQLEAPDGKLGYFDHLFRYNKKGENYTAHFPDSKGRSKASNLKFNKGVLSQAYLDQIQTTEENFYREIFSIFRINLKDNILVHSYAYYISKTDYDRYFNHYAKNSSLLNMIDKEAPKNYVKIAWDKTKWQCEEISYWRYILLNLSSLVFILAV